MTDRERDEFNDIQETLEDVLEEGPYRCYSDLFMYLEYQLLDSYYLETEFDIEDEELDDGFYTIPIVLWDTSHNKMKNAVAIDITLGSLLEGLDNHKIETGEFSSDIPGFMLSSLEISHLLEDINSVAITSGVSIYITDDDSDIEELVETLYKEEEINKDRYNELKEDIASFKEEKKETYKDQYYVLYLYKYFDDDEDNEDQQCLYYTVFIDQVTF